MNTKELKKEFENSIRKALFKAWKAGKKQVKTPFKFTLNTDKLGLPVYKLSEKLLSSSQQELIEKIDDKNFEYILHYRSGGTS